MPLRPVLRHVIASFGYTTFLGTFVRALRRKSTRSSMYGLRKTFGIVLPLRAWPFVPDWVLGLLWIAHLTTARVFLAAMGNSYLGGPLTCRSAAPPFRVRVLY